MTAPAAPAAVPTGVPGAVCVRVWDLAEGDLLPGGERVVSVQPDPARGGVLIGTDDGGPPRWYLGAARVVVAHRAAVGGPVVRPGSRVAAFLAAARPRTARAAVAVGSGVRRWLGCWLTRGCRQWRRLPRG